MRAPILAVVVSLAAITQLIAQSPPRPSYVLADTSAYVPRHENPNGRQLVVVYVGGSETSSIREFAAAVRDMKPLLARQAAERELPITIIGVSLDWEVEKGYARLQSMGAWDEVVLGNNWINVGAQHYLWRRPDGKHVTPQVIVFERTITSHESNLTFGDERRLAGFEGWDRIVEWVRSGALLPAEAKR